jgi:hypothetical protein
MPLELTDSEVFKLHNLLWGAQYRGISTSGRVQWRNDWLQLMAKLEIHIQNPYNNQPTDEPPLVEPCFDEHGRPVWPS